MDDVAAVEARMRRLFKGGPLKRLPKRRQDLEMLLALSLVGLDTEGIFDEADINLHLSRWLAEFAAPTGTADHVTMRRYLVDLGFLRRATDGMIYRIRAERLAEVLPAAAKGLDVPGLFQEMELARHQRRESFQP